MTYRHWAPCLLLLSAAQALCGQAPAGAASAHKFALLIGIDIYEPEGAAPQPPPGVPLEGRFAADLHFPNLTGPYYDVAEMRDLLVERFGFPADRNHIHILLDSPKDIPAARRIAAVDAAPTRKNILDALDKYVADAGRGDTVVFYISSHGSLRVNDAGDGARYQLGSQVHKLDNTIVPADAYLGAEDITSHDLRRIFLAAAKRGVHLTAIFDACHSGGQARGLDDRAFVKRSISWDSRDLNQKAETDTAPESLAENPVLVLAASQKDQSAIDMTETVPPHGLFTAALLESLRALPETTPANDLFRRLQVAMQQTPGSQSQQPAIDSTPARRRQPLFGGGEAHDTADHAAIVSVDPAGIVLDIGHLQNVGVGSEFTQINATAGVKARVRVTELLGATRSKVVVFEPAGATVKPADLVERTAADKWVPVPAPPFLLYPGPTNLSTALITAALATVRSSQVTLVRDPSSDPWTHILFWDGNQWTLQAHSPEPLSAAPRPAAIPLGPALTAEALKKNLQPASVLWFDPPLPSELAASEAFTGKLRDPSRAQLATTAAQAMYVLTGMAGESGVSYAWYARADFEADAQTPKSLGAGCSPNSPYPLRTDWITLGKQSPGGAPEARLADSAQKLAKLDGWLTLRAPNTGRDPYPYQLVLEHTQDDKIAPEGSPTLGDDQYTLALALQGSTDQAIKARWVYVLALDCQGTGELLWPQEGPGGKFPTDHGKLPIIPLPGLTFHISPPFGTDSYILLTTATPLPQPDVLNFEGVVRGGTRGVEPDPLASLLQSTSAGTRAAAVATPTTWGTQVVTMHSQPQASH